MIFGTLSMWKTKPRGYASQLIPVPVSSQDKCGWLWQEGHLA